MTLAEIIKTAANGNADADVFLVGWHEYCHLIDDIVDRDANATLAIDVGAMAAALYTTPFFVEHAEKLRPLILLITCLYQDSVEMEGGETWDRRVADVIRHTGADMIRVVALITGGYRHMRRISRDLHSICYHAHHDADGNPC